MFSVQCYCFLPIESDNASELENEVWSDYESGEDRITDDESPPNSPSEGEPPTDNSRPLTRWLLFVTPKQVPFV